MNPDDYSDADGMLALHEACRSLAQRAESEDVAQLVRLMTNRAGRTYEKHEVPRIVAAAIAACPDGIIKLQELISEAPGHIYPLAIIETLWRIADAQPVPDSMLGIKYSQYAFNEEQRTLARIALGDTIAWVPDGDQEGTPPFRKRSQASLGPLPGALSRQRNRLTLNWDLERPMKVGRSESIVSRCRPISRTEWLALTSWSSTTLGQQGASRSQRRSRSRRQVLDGSRCSA